MYLWGLSLLPYLGSIRIKRLVHALGSESAAFHATQRQLQTTLGMNSNHARAIIDARSAMDIEKKWHDLNATEGMEIVTWLDTDYPYRLQQIADPPPVIYCQGDLACVQGPTVAIVGRRRASNRGLGWARRLGRELAQAGLTVVSGLALGIDTAAHEGSLMTGKTAAVLGTGLDVNYPKRNRQLAKDIAHSGVLITPFPPGTPPLRGNFPARNRVISGLSVGVIVVEAGKRSGALITASMALDQDRDVYAVPGDPLDSGAAGPNRLIQEGAKLIRGAEDVLDEMRLARQLPLPTLEGFPGEEAGKAVGPLGDLLSHLGEPLHVDELALRTGLSVSKVNSSLLRLQLIGLVEELSAGVFQRVS